MPLQSPARHARPVPSVRLSRGRALRVLVAPATALALVATVSVTAATPASTATAPIIAGVTGDAASFSRMVNAPTARHAYGQMEGSVPTGEMVNMAPNVSWRTVANAQPGSSTYNHIVRWAQTLKGRGSVMFAFHHEPEASTKAGMGTAADYVAGYRRVHAIFQAQGATNVKWTWQMTANAFRVSSGDARYAAKWYPGDSYVHYVGADPYNWNNCGPGRNGWKELSYVAAPALAWAKAHGKKLALPEFASHVDYNNINRRAEWIRNATKWFIANQGSIAAVFYFHNSHRPDCHFPLKYAAELDAYGDMLRTTSSFTAR